MEVGNRRGIFLITVNLLVRFDRIDGTWDFLFRLKSNSNYQFVIFRKDIVNLQRSILGTWMIFCKDLLLAFSFLRSEFYTSAVRSCVVKVATIYNLAN